MKHYYMILFLIINTLQIGYFVLLIVKYLNFMLDLRRNRWLR
jgi:hypothetical protein